MSNTTSTSKDSTKMKGWTTETIFKPTTRPYSEISSLSGPKPLKSLLQRAKNALKEIGTSPFQYESGEDRPTSDSLIITFQPPSRI